MTHHFTHTRIPERLVLELLLLALLLVGNWLLFYQFMMTATLAGMGAAVLLRRWNSHHPATLPLPRRQNAQFPPTINLCAVPVGGDSGGLLFAVGAVVVILLGVPGLLGYFIAALATAVMFAWGLSSWRRAHPSDPLRDVSMGLR